ncbi:hypothetical protein B0H11DRAFT_1949722 [Mycena galericulata]|nr:hypothetical protein B0H11DRAFT_1949722 [Mycena galericulata]
MEDRRTANDIRIDRRRGCQPSPPRRPPHPRPLSQTRSSCFFPTSSAPLRRSSNGPGNCHSHVPYFLRTFVRSGGLPQHVPWRLARTLPQHMPSSLPGHPCLPGPAKSCFPPPGLSEGSLSVNARSFAPGTQRTGSWSHSAGVRVGVGSLNAPPQSRALAPILLFAPPSPTPRPSTCLCHVNRTYFDAGRAVRLLLLCSPVAHLPPIPGDTESSFGDCLRW